MARKVTKLGDRLLISFEYEPRLVQLVRGLPQSRWDPENRHWYVPAEHVISVVELLRSEGFQFDQATQELYQERLNSSGQDLTVSQLNSLVRKAILSAFPIPVWVVGEILGYQKSAHKRIVDFHLVERQGDKIVAQVEAYLFPEARDLIETKLKKAGNPFQLQDELTVRVLARVDLWTQEGIYRLIVEDLDINYTLGEAARRREEILRKLTQEGILEKNKSLPFPLFPLRVGLITSLNSDAERDVLKTLSESGFAFQVTVHGARVQGRFTEISILNALSWFREHVDQFDVILICRGGGSRAELSWFDSEALARAVAHFPIPVVIGIGHEADWSVLDYVGWRAKTPTAAAKLLVERVQKSLEGMKETVRKIEDKAKERIAKEKEEQNKRRDRLQNAVARLLEGERDGLAQRKERILAAISSELRHAKDILRKAGRSLPSLVGQALGQAKGRLSLAQLRLLHSARRELRSAKRALLEEKELLLGRASLLLLREAERLELREKRLWALDPKRVVERGFAILRLGNGRVVTEPAQAPLGTLLRAELRGGKLRLLSQGEEKEEG